MKELFITIGYYLLALIVLPLKGMLYLLMFLIFAPLWFWEKWRYSAQCLRYPPPPGGMYGNMLRAYKDKQDKKK